MPFLAFCSIQETGQEICIWKPGFPCSAVCLLQDIVSCKVYSVPDREDLMCPFCSYKISRQTVQSPSQRCLLQECGSCLQSEERLSARQLTRTKSATILTSGTSSDQRDQLNPVITPLTNWFGCPTAEENSGCATQ